MSRLFRSRCKCLASSDAGRVNDAAVDMSCLMWSDLVVFKMLALVWYCQILNWVVKKLLFIFSLLKKKKKKKKKKIHEGGKKIEKEP